MDKLKGELIAPCGMNCALCFAYQRNKKQCEGCHGKDNSKPRHCVKCVVKNCPTIQNNKSGFCYECDKYPCRRLKQLDAHYQTNYKMSMIANLNFIRENGVDVFLDNEIERWTCNNCGHLICIHREICPNCQAQNRH